MENFPIGQNLLGGNEPSARIFTFTKNDVEARQSNVVTSQLLIANTLAHVLIDSGATHSFASCKFAECVSHDCDVLRQGFSISMPYGEILFSSHWLQAIPMIISGRELYVDLVVLNMHDYNVILGMDLLRKYNDMIKCQNRKIIFRPPGEVEIEYIEENGKRPRQ